MALDGIFLNSLLNNLKETLLEAKIDKINQPEKDEIILTFRRDRKNIKLLISSCASFPRLHFTTTQKENPIKAPMFLMVLRKYLIGGRIISIEQLNADRVVIFTIESSDELGFDSVYSLIVEIMGRHSNITLVRNRDNKVMESIKHITPDINSYRILYPGVTYVYPPESKKLDPFKLEEESFQNYILENSIEFNENFFSNLLTGVSKPLSKELYYNMVNKNISFDNVFSYIQDFISNFDKNCVFCIYKNENGIYKDFYCLKLTNNPSYKYSIDFDSPSEMLDDFFSTKDKQERLINRSTDLQKLIHTNIERCLKKSKILNDNLKESSKKESVKIKGDLLTSYIYLIKDDMDFIEVENFYSENCEKIKIQLEKGKTPSYNIQKYYKRYNKLKVSEEWAISQLEKNEEELNYLNSVMTNILNVESYDDIEQIKTELKETGYVKFRKSKNDNKKSKTKEGKPHHFISSTGMDIYVGKNNLQNDYLSLKFAHRNDMWLHTKEIPGSHVIIKGENIDDETLREAAIIAAFYSKGKESSKVPVDYTMVRNLKKPNGSKPGMVIYSTNKTYYAEPKDFETLNIIRKN